MSDICRTLRLVRRVQTTKRFLLVAVVLCVVSFGVRIGGLLVVANYTLFGAIVSGLISVCLGLSTKNHEFESLQFKVIFLESLVNHFGDKVIEGDSIQAIALIKIELIDRAFVIKSRIDGLEKEELQKVFDEMYYVATVFFRIPEAAWYSNQQPSPAHIRRSVAKIDTSQQTSRP